MRKLGLQVIEMRGRCYGCGLAVVTALRLRWDLRGVIYKIELFLRDPEKFVVRSAKITENP
jgi:Fe-S cluster biogenesis protein NfuA